MRSTFSILLLPLLAVVLVVTAARLPGVARANCGGIYSETAAASRHGQLAPLAIGDSTLILSLPALKREGISANAHGCRQYGEGLALLDARRRHGALPMVAIVALGANGPVTEYDVTKALAILGPGRVLVMVTSLRDGRSPGPDTGLIRREPRKHPGRVVVLDWVAYSARHGGWFQPDGLHLTYPGAAAYARFLGRAIPLTAPLMKSPQAHTTGFVTRPHTTTAGGGARIAWALLASCVVLAGLLLARNRRTARSAHRRTR